MSLGEAIISSIIIFVTAIIVVSSAKTTTVTNQVEADEVEIVWQQRLVHNAINNPYIELSTEETNANDPDSALVASAGFVPYTGVTTADNEDSPAEVSQESTSLAEDNSVMEYPTEDISTASVESVEESQLSSTDIEPTAESLVG